MGQATATQEDQIKRRCSAFVDAWNSHDPKALAGFWAEEGDVINPFGRIARGNLEVERLFEDEHATFMRETTYTLNVDLIRFISPECAVVDWDGEIAGMRGTDGAELPTFKHHVTCVAVLRDGAWMFFAGRPISYLPPPGMPAA